MALTRSVKGATCFPAAAVLVLAAGFGSGAAAADDKKADKPAARAAVARCITATGTILRREAPGMPWRVVKGGEELYTGDMILGTPGAMLESKNRAVRLTFVSDPSGTSPLPIIETAIVLHESKGEDLDFRLDRGRVEFASRKDKGDVHVRPRLREGVEARGDVIMEPGAVVSLELFGRWPPGVPFKKDAKPDEGPGVNVIFMVVEGEITLRIDNRQFAMRAPPGPALVEWDSVLGGDPAPRFLKELPSWARGNDNSETAKQRKAVMAQFRELMMAKGIDAAADALLNSDDPNKRRAGIFILGALDELDDLGKALSTTKHLDVWENGVIALRHWIGRGPGQDQRLYQGLIKEAGFRPVDAEAALQLLHSFGERDLALPETYETLIDYLEHERLAIRGLAHWHLVRLVPDGQKIGYNPLAAKEARDKATQQWRTLVPRGKMPPKPGADKP